MHALNRSGFDSHTSTEIGHVLYKAEHLRDWLDGIVRLAALGEHIARSVPFQLIRLIDSAANAGTRSPAHSRSTATIDRSGNNRSTTAAPCRAKQHQSAATTGGFGLRLDATATASPLGRFDAATTVPGSGCFAIAVNRSSFVSVVVSDRGQCLCRKGLSSFFPFNRRMTPSSCSGITSFSARLSSPNSFT